jgi:hypothetical protein
MALALPFCKPLKQPEFSGNLASGPVDISPSLSPNPLIIRLLASAYSYSNSGYSNPSYDLYGIISLSGNNGD